MAVVVAGILVLRLHAFLALTAAAMIVAVITPARYVYRQSVRQNALQIVGTNGPSRTLLLKSKSTLPAGSPLLLLEPDNTPTGYHPLATLHVMATTSQGETTAEADSLVTITPSDFIVDPAANAAAIKAAQQSIGERVAEGFGRTAQEIGILIAMAAVLGKALMASGGAERIVTACRDALGDRHAALALLLSSFILAALVLSDTTFYLLIPLAQVMRLRSGRDYLLYVLAIVAGATMTHSLVPPAAGPAAVAAELHVDLLPMILGGIIIGAIASSAGYLYALWANRRWTIPLRPTFGATAAELQLLATRDESTLPPLWLALAPIVLPVLLIASAAIANRTHVSSSPLLHLARTLGEKNVALAIGAAIGLLMVYLRPRSMTDQKPIPALTADALASAGVMVLIISAGGAFGQMLRQTDIADTLRHLVPASRLGLLPLAFFITAAVRTAQGSAIVAMITAAGIVGPIAAGGSLGFHPVYLALAIGCGSKPIAWMNDAGFWIIGRVSGLTESETLKTATILMTIMGVTGLLATIAGAWLFPFA